jgi:hypothetical protein
MDIIQSIRILSNQNIYTVVSWFPLKWIIQQNSNSICDKNMF